jgi:hypothetical protein
VVYDEAFLDAFKTTVSVRAWDKSSRVWTLPEEYAPTVRSLCKLQFGVVPDQPRPARVGPVLDPWAVLGLSRAASTSDVRCAYRRLAVALHPDHAGSHELFLLVQQAYQTLGGAK